MPVGRSEPIDSRDNDYFPYAASALSGLVVCLALTITSGGKEAVDTAGYFTLGVPLMAVLIFVLSYLFPARAWRWTMSMAAGQLVAMLLSGSSLSLWPIAIIAMMIYSIPQFLAGLAGSRLARRQAA